MTVALSKAVTGSEITIQCLPFSFLQETNLWDLFTEVETKLVPILAGKFDTTRCRTHVHSVEIFSDQIYLQMVVAFHIRLRIMPL